MSESLKSLRPVYISASQVMNSQSDWGKSSCSCVARATKSTTSASGRIFSPVRGRNNQIGLSIGVSQFDEPVQSGREPADWRAVNPDELAPGGKTNSQAAERMPV